MKKCKFYSCAMAIWMVCLLTMTSCAAAEASTASGRTDLDSAKLASESQPASSFSDVPADAWYAEAIAYCWQNGIMSGTSSTTFAPEATLTRAMLATVLHRMSDTPVVSDPPAFTDAVAKSWYSDAVSWAAKAGVMEGYGSGIFGVNDPTTREQAVTILWRYAGNPESAGTAGVADFAAISTWAQAAVRWAEANGILDGMLENNRFDPKANIKRGEVASMLYHYLNSNASGQPEPAVGGKTLVAYFSATNTTRPLAEYVSDILKADLYEIVPEDPYTDADLAYYTNGRADREQNDPSARPAISGGVENIADYDVIFLGYPIWHGQPPRIISTFLESYDFSDKTIVPFCTSHSSGYSDSSITPLAPNANWLTGKRFPGGTSRSTMEEWINGLDLPEKEEAALPYDGVYPQHEPYDTGIGAMPGRVVWTHDPNSVDWNGQGYWWELDHFDGTVIQRMVDDSIASLGGKDNAKDGWAALFQAKNSGAGYRAGEKIAIKANINGSAVMDDDTSGETAMSYTNPVLLKALLTSLVEDAGVAPGDITVYDVSRLFPDYMVELCTGGNLRGVQFMGRNNGVADENAPIQWSHQFSGKVNYLPTCVTEAKYVINLANLKGHSYGITLCGKNHFGSFINGNLMRPPEGANLHQWLTRNEMGIYSPLVDLMANADLGGKTVLYMLDALICAPSEGASITADNSKWQQAPFNGHYTASVFASQDPVAIDSVGADFLMNEPAVTSRNGALRDNATVENYLHEAGLVSHAPSGTTYTDSQSHTVSNLGVHEHWNNSTQKQYSRNLGRSEGIELVQIMK